MDPSGQTVVVVTFVASLVAFTAIGVASARKRVASTEDYLLAGGDVRPWLVALSSVATMSSGFMFVGMIGFTYTTGFGATWMLAGWATGDYLAWRHLYPRVKRLAVERDEVSALGLLWPRDRPGRHYLVRVAAILTVVYLSMYAAAQLKAGSTALESMFGVPPATGAIVGAVIVVLYCFSGGLRASIWTDAAQSIVMLGSMLCLLCMAVLHVGGPEALYAELHALDPALVSPFGPDLRFGALLYVLSMVAGGFGVVGAPHVLVRTMCIDDASEIRRARRYYFAWLLPFYATTIAIGLYARVLLPDLLDPGVAGTPEQALSLLGLELLPAVLVGLTLAGLFSATMSTADSQLIACTTAVTQDIFTRWRDSYRLSKAITLAVTALALVIAVRAPDTVYDLVLDAWGVMACSIGPLMVFAVLGSRFTQLAGLASLATGFVVANLWTGSTLAASMYVNLPGMAAAALVLAVARTVSPGDD